MHRWRNLNIQFHQGSMWCDSNERHAYQGSTASYSMLAAAEHAALSFHSRLPTVTIHFEMEELDKQAAWW